MAVAQRLRFRLDGADVGISFRLGLPGIVCDRGDPLAAKTTRETSYKHREARLRHADIR